MSNLSTLPKGDSAWLLRKAIQRIIQQVSVLETNIGSSTTGNSANTQVIFNDNGTLRGDAGLTYNAASDILSFGAGICYGDLTVRTTGLILNTSGLGVGISPTSFGAGYGTIQVSGATGSGIRMGSPTNGSFIYSDNTWLNILTETNIPHRHFVNNQIQYTVQHPGIFTWLDGAGGTRMTLNSTGLGVGASPGERLTIQTALTGTTAGSNTVGRFQSNGSGYDAHIALGDNVNPSARVGYLSSAMYFWTNGAERMRIDSSGNVGVGVTPSAWRTSVPFKAFQIGYTGAMYGLGSTEQINITSNYLQNTAGNEVRIQAGYVTRYQQSSGQHIWSYAGTDAAGSGFTLTQAMTLDASGNLTVANGNVILGTSGKGIDFSATASGSGTMTSELLNDYEEGTWTPVVKFGTTTATQSNTKTSYTKIGRQVTCFIETYITNLNGGTGNFELSGLPFTSMAMRSAQGDFLFQFMSASFPSGDKMAFINDSSTSFGILYFTGASGTALPLTDADFTTSSYLYARIVYFV